MPKINRLNEQRKASETWLRDNNKLFRGELEAAVKAKVDQHAAEKGDKNISPDVMQAFEHVQEVE